MRKAGSKRVDTRPVFAWLEIPCASGQAACEEAMRRQEAEPRDVERICLQKGVTKHWAARRTPRSPEAFQPAPYPEDHGPLWARVGDKALDAATGAVDGLLGGWR
jgi:hypothetical protein